MAFTYRKAGTAEVATRHVQPWAIASWHGHWYLTGFDTDRNASRVFRLGRIEGKVVIEGKPGSYEVPEDHQPTTMISAVALDRDPQPGTLQVRVGAGHSLRRQARTVEAIDSSWSLITVDFTDVEAFAAEICSFGPDVVVKGPAQLRESVIRLLTGALAGEHVTERANQ
jgi:proteasome accessory factor B